MSNTEASTSDSASGEPAPTPVPAAQPHRVNANLIGEWVGILLAAFLASLLIKTYVVQTFWIPSASMENTLLINDHLLVNKLAYKIGSVKRGDIVVFKRPPGETDKSIDDLIKRVIGLPGDTVQETNGVVYVNGNQLAEPYTLPDRPTASFPATKVPPGMYWVMGDNRSNSSDSRVFGTISKSLIVGKADFRVWPLSRIGTV
jgi:signal peptidase I